MGWTYVLTRKGYPIVFLMQYEESTQREEGAGRERVGFQLPLQIRLFLLVDLFRCDLVVSLGRIVKRRSQSGTRIRKLMTTI